MYIRKEVPSFTFEPNIPVRKTGKSETRVLSTDEERRFVSYLTRDMDPCKFGVLLALMTGLRIGEICAMKWNQISLKDGTITVNSTMQRLKVIEKTKHTKTEIVFGIPKSESSIRTIPLSTGSDTTTLNTVTDTSTSTWNNSETSSQTQTASQSQTARQVISDVLSKTYNVGKSYIHGSSQSAQQGFSSSESQSVNTSTTLTYSVAETTTTTRTYSTDGKSDGWYRLVVAGRLHVFGVVGYHYRYICNSR